MRTSEIPQQAKLSRNVTAPKIVAFNNKFDGMYAESRLSSIRLALVPSHRGIVEFSEFSNQASVMKKISGFTVIELMITIAVGAILLGIAVPSMQDFIARNSISSANNELLAATMYARSEAVMRGASIRVCNSATTSSSTPSCQGDDSWSAGWIVFVDTNANDSADAGETVLRVFPLTSPSVTITPAANNARGLLYDRNGRSEGVSASGSHASGATFTTCSSKVSEGRVLSITLSGRASTAKKDPC